MPGLVNTHNHTPLVITRGMVEDLNFAPMYTPRVPQGYRIGAEEAYLLSRLGAWDLLRTGSTTVVDYYRHGDACARAMAESGLRAFVGGRIHDIDLAAVAKGEYRYDPAIGEATLRENMDIVARWHGHDGGRLRGFLAPHAPDTCSRELLREVAKLADRSGPPVHTHLAQSPDEVAQVQRRDGRRPSEVLDEVGLLGPHVVAGHCILLDADAPNLRPIIDGFSILVHAGVGGNVRSVIVDGRVLMDDGRPTRFDADEVIAAAQDVATRLWAESGWSPVLARARA